MYNGTMLLLNITKKCLFKDLKGAHITPITPDTSKIDRVRLMTPIMSLKKFIFVNFHVYKTKHPKIDLTGPFYEDGLTGQLTNLGRI